MYAAKFSKNKEFTYYTDENAFQKHQNLPKTVWTNINRRDLFYAPQNLNTIK